MSPEAGREERPDLSEAARRSARHRRLEEIFGDVVPSKVRDEVDSARNRPRNGDDWLREQVPPHHGKK